MRKTGTKKRETKRDRFLRLAEHRTGAVLRKLRILGNCHNRILYDYTHEDVQKIFKAIDERLMEVKTRFSASGGADEFKL